MLLIQGHFVKVAMDLLHNIEAHFSNDLRKNISGG